VVLCSTAELPESLKALFRPVSMVVPDLGLICEIMLMAEGFQMSKILSRKFVILYKLCEDLLSKSKHYDWKLRAIKTTLYVAGGMKRAAPELTEDKVRNSLGVTGDWCHQSITVSAALPFMLDCCIQRSSNLTQ
jgi:hypothetical protein